MTAPREPGQEHGPTAAAGLARILADAPTPLMVVDGAGTVRFANPAAARLLGRPPSELEGSRFEHDLGVGGSTRIEVGSGADRREIEVRAEPSEWAGEKAYVVALWAAPDLEGAERRQRALVREHGARVQAEEAAERAEFLAEAARRLSASLSLDAPLEDVVELVASDYADYCILDLVDDGVHRFVAVNEALPEPGEDLVEAIRSQAFDPSTDTPQARAYRDRVPVLAREVDEAWLEETAQDEAHAALIDRLRPRSVIIAPLDSGRACVGLLYAVRTRSSSFRDRDLHLMTELARHVALAIENARLYRDAEAANQAKANFLSVMSHELRTPLSAIIGYTDLIDRGVVGEVTSKQGEYLGRIRASSNHLLQIIEEILAFAGTEAGQNSVHPEELTLRELMAAVTAVAEPLARETDLAFRVEVRDEETGLVTDQRKVRQVLLNLISNALKFTREGEVVVRARVEEDEVVFEVEDTGVGIPPAKQEAIFERFWQLEEALTRSAGGTGLGLTVARSFAKLLNGSLTVASEPGEGSTFTLRIPRVHRA